MLEKLPPAFAGLADYSQFIVYRLIRSEDKIKKIPVDYSTGRHADAHAPTVWTNYETARARAEICGAEFGVGFVLTAKDPFFLLDIDSGNCENGEWSQTALKLHIALHGAGVELSTSGKGMHIIGSVQKPLLHAKKNTAHSIELYTEKRFIALTGVETSGDVRYLCDASLSGVIAEYFQPLGTSIVPAAWSLEPCKNWDGDDDDEELLKRAHDSKSSRWYFGRDTASFSELWHADARKLGKCYPDLTNKNREYDYSYADMALAQHLAFWTGKNCERILKLMWKSKLKREKWERNDYLIRTISNAAARCTQVYTRGASRKNINIDDKRAMKKLVDSTDLTPAPKITTGSRMLTPAQQCELFRGCVYVQDRDSVLIKGDLIPPSVFRVRFGGYSFLMDNSNEQRPSTNAWKAFSESQAFQKPMVDTICFYPNRAPAEIIVENGRTMVNTWHPPVIERRKGDASLFLFHLEKLLPDDTDKHILLNYMASVVQMQGVKFQWAPLIQGVEGNAKTLLTECLIESVGRKYGFMLDPSAFEEIFNSWCFGKTFVGVEDIFPSAKIGRKDLLGVLKTLITNKTKDVRAMRSDRVNHRVCANFMLNTNYKDVVVKTRNDRRFAHFFTAQQKREDLDRDGMDAEYFTKLQNWLAKENGHAIVTDFLYTFKLDRGVSMMSHAPKTSSTLEAREEAYGVVEQEILEAIALQQTGFKKGWVSDYFLDKLLVVLGVARKMSRSSRKAMMATLGYEYHPALPDGRFNNLTLPEGSRSRVYLTRTHPARRLACPGAIAREYTDDQK